MVELDALQGYNFRWRGGISMRKFKKSLLTIGATLLVVAGLGGCGNSNDNKQSASQSTSTSQVKAAKAAYDKALTQLDNGQVNKAYETLKPYKDSEVEKVNQLANNTSDLKVVKDNLDANKLKNAKTKLADLLEVTTPTEFVKQVKATNKEYNVVNLANTYYAEIQKYYQAQKYNEAQGSLESLEDLDSNYKVVAELQQKAKSYKQKVAAALAEDASKSSAATVSSSSTTSTYVNTKNSTLASSQYSSQTGADISSAPSQAVSSVANQLADEGIISQFQAASGVVKQTGDQYFTQDQGDNNYLIEIRTTSATNPGVSVLKGMYRFNTQTKVVQKMDSLTGSYKQVNVN